MSAPDAVPPDLKPLHSLRDFIRWGASEFNRQNLHFGHGTDNALDEAFHLVLSTLKLPFDLPTMYLESNLSEDERAAVLAVFRARVETRKPAPYLTGIAWFCGLQFEIDERALIPRSPIGEMIQRQFQPWLPRDPDTILDLCSGSGCIGIAAAFAFPNATVDLAEIDAGALDLMARNIVRHHAGDRVHPVVGDLFAPLAGKRYDLIVSNPPYVPTAEWAALAPEFQHEPKLALEAGADGMDIVERILTEAPNHLTDEGVLVCEIGGSDDEFEARFPRIPVSWPEFERGGDGVFVIGREELNDWLRIRRRKK
jgi:ribosomal protein L3 glutamine methyltransferase